MGKLVSIFIRYPLRSKRNPTEVQKILDIGVLRYTCTFVLKVRNKTYITWFHPNKQVKVKTFIYTRSGVPGENLEQLVTCLLVWYLYV